MIQLDEIKVLLGQSVFAALNAEGQSRYPVVQQEAYNIINNIAGTGLSIEGEPIIDEQWAVVPFAWIVEFLTVGYLTGASQEYLSNAEFKWREALKICKEHSRTASIGKVARTGEIEGAIVL